MTEEAAIPGNKTIRLQVYLAQCGIGSRRKCEEYILAGRVMVNGKIVNTPGFKVFYTDVIHFDGERIFPEREKIYIALSKPACYLCSNTDRFNRPLAKELFKNKIKQRVFHVGRLDYLSSGLIFYTNDGDFAYHITHPSFEIEKEYIVKTGKRIPESILDQYRQGLRIKDMKYSLKKSLLLTPYKAKLTLIEGKNREIRQVFHYFGIPVKGIHRIRIGIVKINSLKPGEFRHLSRKEVEWFFQ